MLLGVPRLTVENGRARVSAPVRSRCPRLPDEVWMEVDARHAEVLSTRADVFAPGLFQAALFQGEDLRVAGPLCPLLAEGLLDHRDYLREFFPNEFARRRLVADQLVDPPLRPGGRATASAFSGGLDSVYTAWRHRPGGPMTGAAPITVAVHAHGYNMTLDDPRWHLVHDQFRPLLAEIGIELVGVRSNLRHFVEEANWVNTHGGLLACLGHLFEPRLETLLIASSRTNRFPIPWGSDPRLDPRFSSQSLEVYHDECTRTRLDKIEAVLQWPGVVEKLHCCTSASAGLMNCGRCVTCSYVLACLYVLGVRRKLPNFAMTWTVDRMPELKFGTVSTRALGLRMVERARLEGDHAFADSLASCIRRSDWRKRVDYIRHGTARHLRRLIGADRAD
jgi:hypothetical protein